MGNNSSIEKRNRIHCRAWRDCYAFLRKHVLLEVAGVIAISIVSIWDSWGTRPDWLEMGVRAFWFGMAVTLVWCILVFGMFLIRSPRKIIEELQTELFRLREQEEAFRRPNFDMTGPEVYDYLATNSDLTNEAEIEAALANAAFEEKLSVYAKTHANPRYIKVPAEVFRNHTFMLTSTIPITEKDDPWGTRRHVQEIGGYIHEEGWQARVKYISPQFYSKQVHLLFPSKQVS